MKQIKVALIGSGKTMEEYIKVIRSFEKSFVNIVGIYSRNFKHSYKTKVKFKIKKNFQSIQDMYNYSSANVVIIVVSAENLVEVIKEASKYDWKIFTEKPLGINFKQTNEIKTFLDKKINDVYIGLNRQYFGSTIQLLGLLKKDKSKRIINIFDQQQYYSNKLLSKNLMYTNSIHLFTYCPLLARGKLKKIIEIINEKKHIIKKLIYSSGDIIIFHSLWNKPGPWKIEISTINNYYMLNPLEKLFIRSKKIGTNRVSKLSNYDKNFKTGFKIQLVDFFKLIKSNSKKFNFEFYYSIIKIIKRYYKH